MLHAQHPQIFHYSTKLDIDTIPFENLQFLAGGKSAVVYGIDDERVLKEYFNKSASEHERQAYDRAGPHPNIVKLLGARKDGCLVLERGDVLRKICRSTYVNQVSIPTKLGWLKQAADGYQHLHELGIIHSDVGCNNMIISKEGCLKIFDLEGCSIDGGPADSCYEWFSYRPSTPRISHGTDIFAFGCAIYELITGKPPHHGLEASDDVYRKVEHLYTNNEFPDVASLPLGEVMYDCWHGNFSSMYEIGQKLEALHIIHTS